MKLNNPIKEFYKQAELEGRVIKIPQGDIDRARNRINFIFQSLHF